MAESEHPPSEIRFSAHLPGASTNPAPQVHVFSPPAGRAARAALVVFAGGGYWMRAGHEGYGTARHFAEQGLACFVVDYRTRADGYRHPAMLEDALAGIHSVKERANEYGAGGLPLGVLGYSAGGHLAAMTLVAYDFISPG